MALRPQLCVAFAELSRPFMTQAAAWRMTCKRHQCPNIFNLPCGKSAIPVSQAIGAITKLQSHTYSIKRLNQGKMMNPQKVNPQFEVLWLVLIDV
jgi:hypothetical protein